MQMRLEVVVLPVSDVDRAKEFYERLGWRLDADVVNGDDFRVIQLTPPGSPCSIIFGTGITTAAPGSADGLYLVVDDVEAARAELSEHVIATAANCPKTKMVLGGFSQGAAVIGFVTANAVPDGVSPLDVPAPMPPDVSNHVAAVALFGKPSTRFMAAAILRSRLRCAIRRADLSRYCV